MEDNTLIPSYFTTENRGKVTVGDSLNSISLRVGEVKEIVYPEDKLSLSKKWVEYTVEVVQRDGTKTTSSTLHHGCVVGQTFGGFADQVHYTLRKDEQKQGNDPKGGVGKGAKVLLLCINGSRSNPVIISGLPDTEFEDKHKKEDGHNFYFEFNGLSFEINKDGEATLQFKGATTVDGELAEGNTAEPTVIKIKKNGDLNITTKGETKVIIDSPKIELGSADPGDALALASKCMDELKKLQAWQKSMKSTFDGHKHKVSGIKTSGSPAAQTQTMPVDSEAPGSGADSPQDVEEVKSEVVLAK